MHALSSQPFFLCTASLSAHYIGRQAAHEFFCHFNENGNQSTCFPPFHGYTSQQLFFCNFTNTASSLREFFQIIAQLIREASYIRVFAHFTCTESSLRFSLHFTGTLRWQRRLYDKQQTCFIAHFTITASRLRVFLTPHEQPAIYTIFGHLKREKVESSLIVRSHYSLSSLVNTKTFGAVSFLRCTDVVIDCTARRTLGNNNRRQKHGIVKMKVMSVILKCNRRKACTSAKFQTLPLFRITQGIIYEQCCLHNVH